MSSIAPVPFSANLGFLWTEHALPDGIRAAAAAGFDAVECHKPYDTDPAEVTAALAETGLPLVSLNTPPAEGEAGGLGIAAVPGRREEARALIDRAVTYAAAVGCRKVHVMAGRAAGDDARATYIENLTYAALTAATAGVGILIEPINQRNMPGYFLSEVEAAAAVITEVRANAGPGQAANLTMMFDCYHVQIGQGDLLRRFEANVDLVGHVQFAAVPGRNEPDDGEVDFGWLLPRFRAAGYDGFFGAEYRPTTTTEASLRWLETSSG